MQERLDASRVRAVCATQVRTETSADSAARMALGTWSIMPPEQEIAP